MSCNMDLVKTIVYYCAVLFCFGHVLAQDVDHCADNPCLNGATCYPFFSTYTCLCPDRFTGQLCDTDICGPDMSAHSSIPVGDAICKPSRVPITQSIRLAHGCRCRRGFLYDLDKEECVDSSGCQCERNNRFYNVGESFLSEDCLSRSTCVEGNQFQSEGPVGCGVNEECTVVAPGIGECQASNNTHTEERLCSPNPCINGGKCEEIRGGAYLCCMPDAESLICDPNIIRYLQSQWE